MHPISGHSVTFLPIPIPASLTSCGRCLPGPGCVFAEYRRKELSLPIGKLAGYFDCREQETAKDSSPLPEPVLVLCGLPSTKISELLEKMREAGASPIACKASLTDTNRHWSFYQLYEELCREREAIANSASVRHEKA